MLFDDDDRINNNANTLQTDAPNFTFMQEGVVEFLISNYCFIS